MERISSRVAEQAKKHYRNMSFSQAHFQAATKSILNIYGINPFEQGYYFAFNDQIFRLTSKFGNGLDGKLTVYKTAYVFCGQYFMMLGSKFSLAICNKILALYSIPAYSIASFLEFEKVISLSTAIGLDSEFNKTALLSTILGLDSESNKSILLSTTLETLLESGLSSDKNVSLLSSPSADISLTEILRPNAAGDITQLEPSAVPNWECVNEPIPNEDTDYIENSTYMNSTREDLYNLPDTSILATDIISSVTVYIRAKKVCAPPTSTNNGTIMLKTHSTEYLDAHFLTNNYTNYSKVYSVNPNTDLPWTITELNALQIGFENTYYYLNDNHWSFGRCTQVYASIAYIRPLF